MTIDLLEQIHPHIKNSIYPLRITIPDWKMKEGDFSEAASVSTNDRSWTSIRIPFQWGKYDRIFWFRQTIKIGPEFAGKPLVLLFDFPEALLFLNGKPFHGIDQHHKEILICEKSKLNEQFVIAIQAYSGRRHEHNTFASADLAVLDTTARRLDSALNVLQDLDKLINHGSQESKEIRDLIRRTLVFLKYFKPGSDEYPNAIRRAYNFLLNTIETELKTSLTGLIHLIAQSHIAPAWLWVTEESVRKCGRTFSSMLRLMEEFPEFKFAQGQPIFYEFIKYYYPDVYKQIKLRISEGKWEVLGSTWSDTDCNIPNGESLVRQILYGKRFLKQEFGIESNTMWLPNSFGFNGALPQILLKSGITNFYTSKLASNDTTKFPYDSFWWQGIDKSKILSHISPIGLEGQLVPRSILENDLANSEDPEMPILQTFGYGDGGGGATKEHLEFSVVLKTILGLPSSQLSTVHDFFKQLEEKAEDLPTWNNELYLETHRGALTTQSSIKKENRECESLLYSTELLSMLALVFGKKARSRSYAQLDLEQLWKRLLLNQSQSILSGISIADVTEEAHRGFQAIRKGCSDIIASTIDGLSYSVKKGKNEFHFTLFNSQAWQRNEYVELSIKSAEKHFTVLDADGNTVEFQIIERTKTGIKLLCYIQNIPALSFKNLAIHARPKNSETPPSWKVSSHGIETPYYKIRLDGKGSFSSLYAKLLRRELIQKGKRGNFLAMYRDVAKQFEAWNIDEEFEKHRLDTLQLKQVKIIEQGPLRGSIRLEFRTEHGSVISQDVYLYHQSPRIDFYTQVRWHEKQVLMKVIFPLNIKAPETTYEIPFGAIIRSSKPHTDWERAKFEVPAQQWADMSDAKYGISLLNDCKYGYDAKENTLRLTLLRSPHFPDPLDPTRPDTVVTDQGDHSFCYALYPHSGDWVKGETVRRARELNNSIFIFPNISIDNIPSLLESSKMNIVIDSLKKAEDSEALIIRLHEAHGISTDTTLHFGIEVNTLFECDLLENDLKPYKVTKSKLLLKFKPFEIKTLKITPKPVKKKK